MRPTTAKELARREPEMIERANASIHKHPEKLRFSLDRFLASGWSKFETAVAGTQARGRAVKPFHLGAPVIGIGAKRK